MSFSIEVQPRDGGWVKLGTQQAGGYGVLPESLEFGGDLNEYGCLDASFRLKLNPRWPRDIIEQFTPVVISHGTDHRWSGRIIAAPTTYTDDAEVVVQCQGWGQHTKDDCTDREWVLDDLSRFVNTASLVSNAALTTYSIANPAQIGDGAVILPAGNGAPLAQAKICSATLDLGSNVRASRVVAVFTIPLLVGTADFIVYCRLNNSPDANSTAAGFSEASSANPAAGTSTLRVTNASGARYVHVFWYWNGATTTTPNDHSPRFTSVKVFTDAADETGDASILKASTIIPEALAACCPLISTDTSKIATTATSFPAFPGEPGYKYANELIDRANAIHGYIARLSPDPLPVFEFQPQPTDYSYAVGAGEYTLLEPAAQDGRGVYSRVITEYEDAAGVRGEAVGANTSAIISTKQLANSSFDTNTAGWTVNVGAPLVRDTAVFHTSPASCRLDCNTFYASATQGLGGAGGFSGLAPGKRYRLAMQYRRANALIGAYFDMKHVVGAGVEILPRIAGQATVADTAALMMNSTIGAWVEVTVDFIAPADGIAYPEVQLQSNLSSVTLGYVDSFVLYEVGNTVVDRRGFTRTALDPFGQPTNATIATAVANLKLSNSQFPPFKGTIGITGRVRTKGGSSAHVSALPARVGDAILIENLTDPNTGALGRQGIIQTAKYVEKDDRVELTIDSAANFLTQLKARLRLGTR